MSVTNIVPRIYSHTYIPANPIHMKITFIPQCTSTIRLCVVTEFSLIFFLNKGR